MSDVAMTNDPEKKRIPAKNFFMLMIFFGDGRYKGWPHQLAESVKASIRAQKPGSNHRRRMEISEG
jgi:hypothetical protein